MFCRSRTLIARKASTWISSAIGSKIKCNLVGVKALDHEFNGQFNIISWQHYKLQLSRTTHTRSM